MKSFIYFKVLPALNRLIFNPLRLKLVTARTPNRNFTEFFAHLRKLSFVPKTVVDVGVGNGTSSLYSSNPHADLYLIEAVPDTKGTVRKIASQLNAKFFNVAAGASSGEIEFFVHDDTTGSSMYRQLEGANLDGAVVKVPVKPLDDLLPESINRPCVLKVDTQGAEIEVIKGASRLLKDVDIAILEVSLHQFRAGTPEIGAVIAAMAERGFVIYEILEGHYRSLDNALAQLDVVFVPENSILRVHKEFFSEEQAKAYLSRGALR
ncbi:MAG: FkbM family methyltransferase [Rhizobium sp.]|nr:FkbM family methyltransferase [Rhizobium sp.]MDM8013345.1 FkbM family methyltransferase [Rhizobium sp.]